MNLSLSACLWPGDQMENLLGCCLLWFHKHFFLCIRFKDDSRLGCLNGMIIALAILEIKRCLAGSSIWQVYIIYICLFKEIKIMKLWHFNSFIKWRNPENTSSGCFSPIQTTFLILVFITLISSTLTFFPPIPL